MRRIDFFGSTFAIRMAKRGSITRQVMTNMFMTTTRYEIAPSWFIRIRSGKYIMLVRRTAKLSFGTSERAKFFHEIILIFVQINIAAVTRPNTSIFFSMKLRS